MSFLQGNLGSGFSDQKDITLGMLIDGFFRLSQEDKDRFCLSTGLSASGTAGFPALPNVPAGVPQKNSNQVGTLGNPMLLQAVAAGQVPKTPAAQQAAGFCLPGSTVDPKTGKVFRLNAPKARSQQRETLTNVKEQARLALAAFTAEKRIQRDADGKVKSDLKGSDLSEYTALLDSFKAAKAALASYKLAHPGEFQESVRRTVRGPKGA